MKIRENVCCICVRARKRKRIWRYRFVPILYCHNSLCFCYSAQKSNQTKYCLACRRSLRVRRCCKILIDCGNVSFSCGSSTCIELDNARRIRWNSRTRIEHFANEKEFFQIYLHTFTYITLYIFSVISRVLRAYIVQILKNKYLVNF